MNKRVVALCLILVYSGHGMSYRETTHAQMARKAFDQSALQSDAVFFQKVGIDLDGKYLSSQGDKKTVKNLISWGAWFEDDIDTGRSAHHFFDPRTGFGYYNDLWTLPSPGWALEDAATYGAQDYSYGDAVNHLYNWAVSPETNRPDHLGFVFQSLGHVIHHIQDMAQPAHVRRDAHFSHPDLGDPDEDFPAIEHYSRYEQHAQQVELNLDYLSYGVVGGPEERQYFGKPRHFWRTAVEPQNGRGMAEYTNSKFLSEGTNFDTQGDSGDDYELPSFAGATPHTIDATWLFQNINLEHKLPNECKDPNPHCGMTFYRTNVPDLLRPSQTTTNAYTSTRSIFDEDLNAHAVSQFSLNRFNFAAAESFLVKRAVGYSTGLINFFFRGRMELSLPAEGIYAAVDHLTFEGSARNIGGFSKIRVNVKNITPASEVMPLGQGALRLVARYHLNTCYEPTLEGEFGTLKPDGTPQLPDWRNCWGSTEQVRVSEPRVVPTGINSEGADLTFHFADRVPINATNLSIQVVYRGQLGEDPEAIVLSPVLDISEPAYIYLLPHRWDQFKFSAYPSVSSGPYTWEQWCAQGGMTLAECNDDYGFRRLYRFSELGPYTPANESETDRDYPIAQEVPFQPVLNAGVPVGTYARVAVLTDIERPAGSPHFSGPYYLQLILTENGVTAPETYRWTWFGMGTSVVHVDKSVQPYQLTLSPNARYKLARGIYIYEGSASFWSTGTADQPYPILTPRPTVVNFPD